MKDGVRRKLNLVKINPFMGTMEYVDYDEEATPIELECLSSNQYVGYSTFLPRAPEPVIFSNPSTSTEVDNHEPQLQEAGLFEQIKFHTRNIFRNA